MREQNGGDYGHPTMGACMPSKLTRTTSDDVSPERPPKGRGLWVSTSEELVEYWERKLLSGLHLTWATRRVDVTSVLKMHPEARTRPAAAATQPGELFIHTLVVEPKIGDGTAGDSVQKPVLLLIPGFACGHAVFFRQLDQFAKAFRVFAVDLLGFGLSARPPFQDSPDGSRAESLFVDAIEAWRQALGISRMSICGHSFGGYIATCYALRYPRAVEGLVLIDPWGFMHPDPLKAKTRPLWAKAAGRAVSRMNIISLLQHSGPLGYRLFRTFRRRRMCVGLDEPRSHAMLEYLYHHNVYSTATTGAQGFKSLLAPFAFAKRPLIDRVHALAPHLPILFVYGGKSWLSSQSGYDVQKLRQDHWHPGPTRVVVIQEAGHNVFVDAPAALSEAVLAFPQMLAQAAFHSPQFQPSLACTGMVPPLLSESQMFAGPSSFPVMLLAQNVAAQ